MIMMTGYRDGERGRQEKAIFRSGKQCPRLSISLRRNVCRGKHLNQARVDLIHEMTRDTLYNSLTSRAVPASQDLRVTQQWSPRHFLIFGLLGLATHNVYPGKKFLCLFLIINGKYKGKVQKCFLAKLADSS